jgi:MerR family transcriptional regulator, light-induced transcriptional regulator
MGATIDDALQARDTGSRGVSRRTSAATGAYDSQTSLSRLIEETIVPRLLGTERPAPTRGTIGSGAQRILENEVQQFVLQLLTHDDAGIAALLATLLKRGVTTETIYLDLFAPTARRFGEFWLEDTANVLEVTVAVGRLQSLVRELSHKTPRNTDQCSPRRHAVFATMPGDVHTFGIEIVAELFRNHGWDVRLIHPRSISDLATIVRSEAITILGLSASNEGQFATVAAAIRALRLASCSPDMKVVVGGTAFAADTQAAIDLGADEAAVDAHSALRLARMPSAESRRKD